MKALVLGAAVVDRAIHLKSLPTPDTTNFGMGASVTPGGKGLNQAVGLRRLGVDTTFIAHVGPDGDGQELSDFIKREKLNPPLPSRRATGFTNILLETSSGGHLMATHAGANADLSVASLRGLRWKEYGMALFQWETDERANLHAARALRRSGARIILNPAPVDGTRKLRAWINLEPLITPNEHEAKALAGLSRFTPPGAAARFRRLGFPIGVITLGKDGAYWWQGPEEGHVPSRKVRAVDCVGAGDSFNAGLASALLEGRTLPEAVTFAHGCAAVAVSRKGTATALPHRREVGA